MARASEDRDKHKKPGGRSERLAAALRENLRRRKAQEKARDAKDAPAAGSGGDKGR